MLPLCCQDVSAACHLLSGGHLTKNYYLSFLSLVLSRCVIFCQQPVKMCHLLSGGHLLLLFILFVPCAVKMCHLLSAACQDVSSFVRWTFIIIYPFCPLCYRDVSSFVSSLSRCVIFCQVDIYYPFCPLCCQDVSSFVSSLSRCAIFCQVGIYYLSEVNHCGQQYNRGKPERAPVLLIEHGTYIAHTKIS